MKILNRENLNLTLNLAAVFATKKIKINWQVRRNKNTKQEKQKKKDFIIKNLWLVNLKRT